LRIENISENYKIKKEVQAYQENKEPIPHHKWDLFTGRATVEGTVSYHSNECYFLRAVLEELKSPKRSTVTFKWDNQNSKRV
jgi:hypothetical protein